MSSEAGRFCVFYPDGRRMCGEPAVDTVVLASGQGGLDICAAHLDDLLNHHCLCSHRQPEQHPQGEEGSGVPSEAEERRAVEQAAAAMYESKPGRAYGSWSNAPIEVKATWLADAERAFDAFRPLLLKER